MNVYDFDGTIYSSDCAVNFAMWYANRHPWMWITFVPKAALSFLRYKKGKIHRYKMQRTVFSFMSKIKNFDATIEKFWDKHEKRISAWYLKQKKPDDLIISATADCIIAPIAKRLGVKFVASEYDIEYGVFTNNVMYAKEKARYIIDHGFPVIENFYSDSLSDTPLALCAEKAHLVTDKASKVTDWPDLDKETMEKVRRKIDMGTDVHLDE